MWPSPAFALSSKAWNFGPNLAAAGAPGLATRVVAAGAAGVQPTNIEMATQSANHVCFIALPPPFRVRAVLPFRVRPTAAARLLIECRNIEENFWQSQWSR